MSMLQLARNTCRKRRRIQWHFITGIFILFSFGLVYRRLTNTPSFANGLSNPTQTLKDNETEKAEIRFTKEIEEDRSIIACKVPNVDPFHPSVVKFMRDVGKLNCQGPRFSSYDNNVLRIEGQGLVSAQYRKILRAPGNDFSVVLSDPVKIQNETSDQKGSFHGEAAVDHDFIRVEVVTSSGATKSDVHMHVFPKQEVLKREQKPGGIPLNVALVMFDSTSTANFKRKLPKSWKHLTTNLNSIVMRGETIVGDGTTSQLAAMLTGLPEKNQQDARKRKSSSKTVDSWRWIFKDLKEKGYATCFSEDSPGTAAFNYRLNGFRDPPTDHYGRPFWMEADKLLRAHCVNSRASHNVSFEYLLSFFRRYRDRPRFAFASHGAISHDDINTIGYVDDDLKIFLDEFEKESFLDNTMLIIFSDHGARFSNLRKTLQGKLEERLPFMSITLPKWFQEKYPDLNNNLVNNSHILTSPFDVYATLRHILSYPQYPSGIITGQSLFSRIERTNRTCASTGVADHYCPCLDLEVVSLDEPVVKEITAFVLKHINDLTSHTDELSKLCQRLQLKEIKSAFREMPKEALQRFERAKHAADDRCDGCEALLGQKTENTLVRDTLYQIQFTTSPNEGFYEVSVRMKQGVPELTAEISRIDAYKNQADCISNNFPLLRKYCYCSTISSSRVK